MLVRCAVLLLKGRNAYLAGGIEATTLINVEITVMAGGIDTEVTVEVTWEGAMLARAPAKLAGGPQKCKRREKSLRGDWPSLLNIGGAETT